MKVISLVEFSGVPKGTTGICEYDTPANREGSKKVTWDLDRSKPLVDWFTDWEFKKYLEVLEK
ncbi:MAG: hypothetical protein KJI69_04680 [Patescibacteria group bacterium]|nr:hypothetical protein [Patescibacteria group bacterium]